MNGPAARGVRRSVASLAVAALLGALLAACGGGVTVTSMASAPTSTGPATGPTLTLEHSPAGPILADAAGFTLYDFAPDTPNHSACTSSLCVRLWPPLVVQGTATVGPGLDPSLVGWVRRADGTRQVTYGGHPLYTWAGDSKPGMVTGQALLNVGGYWYVISPSGAQITNAFTVRN